MWWMSVWVGECMCGWVSVCIVGECVVGEYVWVGEYVYCG